MNFSGSSSLVLTQAAQVTLAIGIIGIATKLLFRRWPQVVYALWLVVLVKCFVPPLFSSRMGVVNWISFDEHAIPTVIRESHSVVSQRKREAQPWEGDAPAGPESSARIRLGGNVFLPAHTSVAKWKVPSAATLWAGTYLAVAAAIILMALLRYRQLRRQALQTTVEVPSRVRDEFTQLAHQLGLRRPPPLVISPNNFGPSLIGLIRPTVVIPQTFIANGTELAPALAHELLHMRRRDHWVAAAQVLCTSLWWFHPGIWWMNREISHAREMSCDEQVIASLRCPPEDYGQMLIDVMKLGRQKVAMNFILGVRSIDLTTHRLEHIVNNANHFHCRVPRVSYVLMVLLSLLLLPGARLAAGNAAPTTAPGNGRTFSGTVLDGTTEKPIAGATVTLHREIATTLAHWDEPGKPQEITTDANGKFEFTVSPAEMANKKFCIGIEARAAGYTNLAYGGVGMSLILNELNKGHDLWFTKIKLTSGEEVSGVIEDPDGKPLGGCLVKFHSISGEEKDMGMKYGKDVVEGDVMTDASGRFSFCVIKGSKLNMFSAAPDDFAPLSQRFDAKRGELGAFRLQHGQRITGVVVDESGKPQPGLHVSASSDKQVLIFQPSTARQTTTDAAGRFTLAPGDPDRYIVTVKDERFMPVHIKLDAEAAPAPIEFRPPPFNTIKVHFVDSSGQASKNPNSVLAVAWAKDISFQTGFKDGPEAQLRVPKGMENTELMMNRNDGITLMWRVGNSGDWRRGDAMWLGMLQEPITDVTIMEFESPRAIVRAVDPAGKAITKFQPQITYLDRALTAPTGQPWGHGVQGDVSFEPSRDGASWTTRDMLFPNRRFLLRVEADGFVGGTGLTSLKEGEKREITLELKAPPTKAADAPSARAAR